MSNPALTFDGLTEAQATAIAAWWNENDPDGYTYEYVDNVRYAIQGNPEQEAAYEQIRMNGCCGSRDVELQVEEQTLLYGFNYGH